MVVDFLGNFKYGKYLSRFMLCDRCVIGGDCKRYSPGARCAVEKSLFKEMVTKLIDEYELDTASDKMLAETAVMQFIHAARAEKYEAKVGFADGAPEWGEYINKMYNSMRRFLNDLAVTRSKRIQSDKTQALLEDVDHLLDEYDRPEGKVSLNSGRRARISSIRVVGPLVQWRRETAAYRKAPASSGEDIVDDKGKDS